MNPFGNYWLVLAVLTSFGLLLLSVYLPFLNSLLSTVPLVGRDWLTILVFTLGNVVLIEAVKVYFSKTNRKAY